MVRKSMNHLTFEILERENMCWYGWMDLCGIGRMCGEGNDWFVKLVWSV
jgi:hypothetical protein